MPPQALSPLEMPVHGLLATLPESLPFAPELHIRTFIARRARGNILVYSTRGLAAADVGDVARHYLNHRHEAMFPPRDPIAPLFVHADDRRSVEPAMHVRGTFTRRHTFEDDFEVIPTPGHTPGATAYLWDNGEHRFLFTGDTIYLRDGEWVAAALPSSDRVSYVESLELLRELDFDVLVPWAATAGDPPHAVTSNTDARRRIDRIIARLRAGEDH